MMTLHFRQESRWKQLTVKHAESDRPQAPIKAAACTFKDNIYCFGGYSQTMETLNDLTRLTIINDRSGHPKFMKSYIVDAINSPHRCGHTLTAIKDGMILCGGTNITQSMQETITNDIMILKNPSSIEPTWQQVLPHPQSIPLPPIAHHCAQQTADNQLTIFQISPPNTMSQIFQIDITYIEDSYLYTAKPLETFQSSIRFYNCSFKSYLLTDGTHHTTICPNKQHFHLTPNAIPETQTETEAAEEASDREEEATEAEEEASDREEEATEAEEEASDREEGEEDNNEEEEEEEDEEDMEEEESSFLAQQLEDNEPQAGDSNFDVRNYKCPAANCKVYGYSLVDSYNENLLQLIRCTDCESYIHLICDGHRVYPFQNRTGFKYYYCSDCRDAHDLPRAAKGFVWE